jgi:chaperonin GroEL (HSP60 family)
LGKICCVEATVSSIPCPQVLVTNPKELEAIRQREADITKEKIAKILAAGANVILTTKVCWRACVQLLPRCICFGVAIRLLTMMRVSVAPYGRVWSRALTMCA